MRFAARIFFSFVFVAFFLLLVTAKANAQTVNPPQNLHNYTQNVMIETLASMGCLLAGVDMVDPSKKCLGIADGKIGPVDAKGGAIGAMGNLIAMTFSVPVHTGDYFGYLVSNFGIAKSAYAQGLGFNSLSPLTDIWIAFRNISYLLFVLVFVVIGFAIMFRVHIDPRTVMTIENQIPRIVIGLILVTFSLAIAGFMIDIMWLLSYLVIEIFAGIDPSVRAMVTEFQGKNALEIANNLQIQGLGGSTGYIGIVTNASGAVKDNVSSLVQGLSGTILGDILVTIGATILLTTTKLGLLAQNVLHATGFLGNVLGGLVIGVGTTALALATGNQILGLLGGLIAFIVIAIALLFALFRLWFTLLKTYIFILLNIVLAPFWILTGLIPGSKIGFTGWLRDMAANLMAYPVTLAMFMLAQVFITKFGATQTSGQFVPPLIGNPGQPNAIGSLIGLGMILLTPGVVDLVRKAFQAPESDLSAVAKSLGVGLGVGGIPTSIAQMGYQFHMAGEFGPFKKLRELVGLKGATPPRTGP